ncbi:BirA family biotin operon repressor/biotin-[acetyl-CoA-carboxylase] ligase [Motilibacter peucedani]|uniref:biotin--[biotin carboxyl-carrier protein] ligase n=1 Tax=Motilibacter peucedani TaxID=598650 RepID=A0A420XMD8_9ACTN|nr:BirA family biotin operon repressor/biotin-[acetyl-CoA-carboxylase] ligase [Motilibacter peucedani]
MSRALEAAGAGHWRLAVVAETGSTNDDLAAAARAGEPPGAVLVADLQTAGRGRLGRRWAAPAGSSLAVSVLVRPGVAADAWGWLPLLTGLSAAEAVASTTGLDARLKWPNDVLVGGRKLAGLLAERVPSPAGDLAVLGIGLNTDLGADELPVPTATSLALEGAAVTDRTPVLAALLVALARRLAAWEGAAGDAVACGLADAYAARCDTLGRRVRLELPGAPAREGTAEGVDADGRLVVDGTAYAAGDVTHLR